MRLKLILLLVILLSSSLFIRAQDGFQVPKKSQPYAPVNDFDNILDPALVQTYNQTLSDYYKKTGRSICVITIPTLGGMDIETAAVDTFRAWGIGDKQGPNRDKGVLLLVVYKERKWRLEVGYGNEGDLPDGKAGEILRANKTFMQQGNPTEAVRGVMNTLALFFNEKDRLSGKEQFASGFMTKALPPPEPSVAAQIVGWVILIFFVAVAVTMIFLFLGFLSHRMKVGRGGYTGSSGSSSSTDRSAGYSSSSSSGGDGGGESGGGGASDSW